SEETGAVASLAAGFVMITGVFGAVIAPLVFKRFNITNDEEKGLALGLSAHAIGTVKAFEISSKCGAYSILAMIVNGIFTAILLPLCFWLF
ncbi:LrgB family protein, partial [Oleiphilus sp. HI0132]